MALCTRTTGELLIDWEQQRAVSRSSKVVAVVLLTASWGVMYLRISNLWLMTGLAMLFIAIMAFLLSRPEPHRSKWNQVKYSFTQ